MGTRNGYPELLAFHPSCAFPREARKLLELKQEVSSLGALGEGSLKSPTVTVAVII